jgi:hypothetical protein
MIFARGSNDNNFIKNLSSKTIIAILKPSEYLSKLNIKKGTDPMRRPDKSNPLFYKNWWRI